jgi:hypothetical protein
MRYGYDIAGHQWWREFAPGGWLKCDKEKVPMEILECKWVCFGPA